MEPVRWRSVGQRARIRAGCGPGDENHCEGSCPAAQTSRCGISCSGCRSEAGSACRRRSARCWWAPSSTPTSRSGPRCRRRVRLRCSSEWRGTPWRWPTSCWSTRAICSRAAAAAISSIRKFSRTGRKRDLGCRRDATRHQSHGKAGCVSRRRRSATSSSRATGTSIPIRSCTARSIRRCCRSQAGASAACRRCRSPPFAAGQAT